MELRSPTRGGVHGRDGSPSRVFLKLPHGSILTFCSAEVQSLAAFGIPYLTDFPISVDLRMTRPALDLMQSLGRWETVPVGHAISEGAESACFSSMPIEGGEKAIEHAFGEKIARLVNLAKVRIYAKHVRNRVYWTRFVPIATLSPLKEEAVEQLFESIVSTIESTVKQPLSALRKEVVKPVAKLRLAQYILSAAVGRSYLSDLSKLLNLKRDLAFSLDEASHLFGLWLRRDIGLCHDAIDMLSNIGVSAPPSAGALQSTQLPIEVAEISRLECAQFLAGPKSKQDNI